ncbi:MAG: HU family DNA-binding protein [Gallionellaceae bacterium]|jgi:nucleoid DNA-binding protein
MSDDNKITLHAFTALVARRAKVSSDEANVYIHQLAKTMAEGLEKGDYIHLYRFGRFQTTHVDEQAGHNPNTGVELTIPEHSRVQFHPYSALRFAVNAPFRNLHIKELNEDKTEWRTGPGAWILAALLLLLLLLLGFYLMGGSSTQDASVVPQEKAVETAVVAQPVQAPAEVMPAVVPVEKETTSTAKVATTGFVVSPGDTLWGIAATTWKDPFWWPLIYAENRAELAGRNPDLIENGITLRLPVLAGSAKNPGAADLRLKADAYKIVADDYRKQGNPRAANYKKVAKQSAKE